MESLRLKHLNERNLFTTFAKVYPLRMWRWRMGRLLRFVFLSILCLAAIGHGSQQNPSQNGSEHTEWIAGVLNATQTIKVGMTRSDLLKGFTTEGGLSWTSQRTYVYRECPYIKVDVKFAASSNSQEFPKDKIVERPRPRCHLRISERHPLHRQHNEPAAGRRPQRTAQRLRYRRNTR
jgi:hypothetical protein